MSIISMSTLTLILDNLQLSGKNYFILFWALLSSVLCAWSNNCSCLAQEANTCKEQSLQLKAPFNEKLPEDKSNVVPGEVCGPKNLLKTMPTPFTTAVSSRNEKGSASSEAISLIPIAISSVEKSSLLKNRFYGPKLYLPSELVLGQCAEFVVKGNPGWYAAIAMAEGNKGAKSIFGHNLRLGADRKLVALGRIPDNGMLALSVEAPIQGDLIGLPLYFECAVWSSPDFNDLQIASTIPTSQQSTEENGVIVAGQPEEKKQRPIVFDLSKPITTRQAGGLSSGKP